MPHPEIGWFYFLGFSREGWNENAVDCAHKIVQEPPEGTNWKTAGIRLLSWIPGLWLVWMVRRMRRQLETMLFLISELTLPCPSQSHRVILGCGLVLSSKSVRTQGGNWFRNICAQKQKDDPTGVYFLIKKDKKSTDKYGDQVLLTYN